MEHGWIYVLVNSSIPGLIKVGRTTREPSQRAAELSAATGVATPFVLAFEQAFDDCVQAEQLIHAELVRRGLRVAANREFFRSSPAEIVRVVMLVAGLAGNVPEPSPGPSATELLAAGDRHRFGHGETLQDSSEAVRFYRLAAAHGSLIALERLGAIHAQSRGNNQAERRHAVRYLRDGARRGNYYCFCEIAMLFAQDANTQNFAKAWDLFFGRRADSYNSELEAGEHRCAHALRNYITVCLDLRTEPAHLPELRDAAEDIVQVLVQALDQVRDAPEARQRLAGTLRWTYENLLPTQPVTAPVTGRSRRIPLWLARPWGVAA
jgi:hypothetical protein